MSVIDRENVTDMSVKEKEKDTDISIRDRENDADMFVKDRKKYTVDRHVCHGQENRDRHKNADSGSYGDK